ncbi:MAG: futalosine hydrolase [Bacteroidetes bacterium]|nr:futalosine hydrolase [Bacteroidota bacterium]
MSRAVTEDTSIPPLLLVAATPLECHQLVQSLQLQPVARDFLWEGMYRDVPVHLVVTGIGPVNPAAALERCFSRTIPRLAVQLGIAGAYAGSGLALGDVVQVQEEVFADFGATTAEGGLLDMQAMGFPLAHLPDGTPLYNVLHNPRPLPLQVPLVKGLTSATVSGHTALIALRQQQWQPQVESMEGATFFQLCLARGVPFAAFRCISNAVAPRNPAEWQIPRSAQRMQEFILAQMAFLCA